MTTMRYAGEAGVIVGSRGTIVVARLSALDLRQQAWRVTATRRGHEGTSLVMFIWLASFRRRSGAECAKAERRSVRVEEASVNDA
jgi:hypothetical protein